MTENHRIVLARRPTGSPVQDDFREEWRPISVPGPGELLLETLYLSLDPYMRGRMSDEASYAAPIALGDVIVGRTISRVAASNTSAFEVDQIVLATSGWQSYAVSDGQGLRVLDPNAFAPTLALGVLGNSGFAAWVGLNEIAHVTAGDTVAVAAATGPVGATVVQLAKAAGARIIAIAGGPDKVAYARDSLGADVAIDHRAEEFAALLASAAPDGIDVYFENVGGEVLFEILPRLKDRARVAVCGLIAWYNLGKEPPGPDRSPALMRALLRKRLRMEGFVLTDWEHRRAAFEAELTQRVGEGGLVFREDVVDGLQHAPSAFIRLLEGGNFGKLMVRVAA